MSTTFGVKARSLLYEEDDIIEVAYRGYGYVKWLNPLAQLLPLNTKVIPLDNSPQGILTIEDIYFAINKYDKQNERK